MKQDKLDYIVTMIDTFGFSREEAEQLYEGEKTEALTEAEVLAFCHAWEHDRVEPMAPLVEKYGWDGLVERLQNSLAET